MKPNRKPLRLYQAGFSLVEIMVGLVIGLLATLVIMQVFSVFEGQKRTTTGAADAQTNGSIALFSLGRELQMTGYGLLPLGDTGVADSPLECATLDIDATAAATGIAAAGIAAISPVIITDGGSTVGTNNTDSITLHYGATNMGGVPSPIKSIGADNVSIDSDLGCQGSDIVLIYNGVACALVAASGVAAATSAVPAVITLSTLPDEAAIDANLACLGTWNEVTFQINNGNLERVSNGTAVPVIAGIVNIQAQYGISASADTNGVVQWVDATSASGWDDPSVADRNRIKAIRIAIVARNGLREKEEVIDTCTSNTSDAPTGLCAWSATSLSPSTASPAPWIRLSDDADGTSWKRYRYRVFETVIPLRNMVWARSTL